FRRVLFRTLPARSCPNGRHHRCTRYAQSAGYAVRKLLYLCWPDRSDPPSDRNRWNPLPDHAGLSAEIPAGYGQSPSPHPLTSSGWSRSEEHTSELQSRENLVCRLLLEKKKI